METLQSKFWKPTSQELEFSSKKDRIKIASEFVFSNGIFFHNSVFLSVLFFYYVPESWKNLSCHSIA